ncbi:MAG: 4-hydroxyphenylpyruvate dioxygenase [Alphaproteobacteria bacterium]|nr:4-hydroxyphenylpyruvate dioxygenase [Alphaproteobacteria bacterium]
MTSTQFSPKLSENKAQATNFIGTECFEFVEFSTDKPQELYKLFENLGFRNCGKHRTQNVTLFKQGKIHFFVNAERNDFSEDFRNDHGSSACSMGFKVKDAQNAYKALKEKGAEPIDFSSRKRFFPASIPAIKGIGGAHLYLIDQNGMNDLYNDNFPGSKGIEHIGLGLESIDHLTHNVYQGNVDQWADYYEKLFNFHEIRYFDIKGAHTGLISRAMSAPCGQIKIPLNESTDDKSQIAEYLEIYKGEGIQHIALTTPNIYETVEKMRENSIPFMSVPRSYYDMLQTRLPAHGEDVERMARSHLLIDGDTPTKSYLLQIFTKTVIGPIFFEIIQRKGHQGFGEGNFQALFDALERDQIERGVLKV